MNSSRSKKLREQNAVMALVKDLTKRMSDFEDSVNELKILKDSILEINDEVSRQETDNAANLERLKKDLKENRIKILNEAAREGNKVLITQEELNELNSIIKKLKGDLERQKAEETATILSRVEEQIGHRLKVQELQHECAIAELNASNTSLKNQVDQLNEYIERMSGELESQKKLTADVARVQTRAPETPRS